MKTLRCLFFLLILVTANTQALSLFPTAGYSSETGLLLGGTLMAPILSPDSLQTGLYTIGAYYGTSGVVSVKADAVRAMSMGGVRFSGRYQRLLEADWFGWGNRTDPDTSAVMDFEKQNLSILFSRVLAPGLMFQAGISARHTTVYDREESELWERAPSTRFGSTWTLGPDAGISLGGGGIEGFRWSAGLSGSCQTGDVTYGCITSQFSAWVPAPGRLELGVSATAARHYGTADTPIPFMPSLGQSQGFRGYSDFRFTGPVLLLCSAEIRKMLLTISVPVFNQPWQAGVAVFADAGQVADSISGLAFGRFHGDAGAGLRLLTQDRLMLKFDGAWGDEGLCISAGVENPF